ncbi:hypothetical protein AB0L13_31975 [Saccharopolyspora shandongensis]|uniref:hypothetical protein n=1 Tax=Saccharopolyspora shandongensis TaxID=418495 RepID=UPI003432068A
MTTRTSPSRETIEVDGAQLELALDDPADDTATDGDRAPYLDLYLLLNTKKRPIGTPSFTVPTSNR